MILKYCLLAFLGLVLITASDPYFGTDFSSQKLPHTIPEVRELSWKSTDAFLPYLNDKFDRVSDTFQISPYYFPMVQFWFLIYTQFESNQVVFHDKNNMSLIYKVLDYSALHKKKLPRNTLYILQQKISNDELKKMKEDLDHLVKNPFSLEPKAKALYRTLLQSGVTPPTNKKQRIIFFKELKENLRTQTGQKNFIRAGIVRARPYQKFLTNYFEAKNLPKEILAIPFLESSFNPRAHSKVSALGAWQFMPWIASYFVPKRTDHLDYRFNIGVASVSAAFLLTQNYQIMKSWDLAVTAYNSGTKHLLKTKREMASSDVSLETIIQNSDSDHFGFASKNFYSEFLALNYALAYQDELFSDIDQVQGEDRDLQFFLAKCSVRLDQILNSELLEEVLFYNHQLKNLKRSYKRGLILTTKSDLPASKFLKISKERILKLKPIDWPKLLRNQSCSTR
jgi:membrane-bound lytic murein transglycosylase D